MLEFRQNMKKGAFSITIIHEMNILTEATWCWYGINMKCYIAMAADGEGI